MAEHLASLEQRARDAEVEAAAEQGIPVSPAMVSQVKTKSKKKRRAKRRKKVAAAAPPASIRAN